MTTSRPKCVINLADVPLQRDRHGDAYESFDAGVAPLVGGKDLGYSLTVIPAGKSAWPFHNHHVNEEMVLVLEGEGTLRIGAERHAIRKGDVLAFPPGGPDTAHQIINTSVAELRVLAVSTMLPSEVVEYPDSGKVSVTTRSGFRFRGKLGKAMEYWEGE